MLEQDIHALSLSSLASVLFPSETRGLVSGGKLSRRLALTFLHFKTVERIGIYASLTIYSRRHYGLYSFRTIDRSRSTKHLAGCRNHQFERSGSRQAFLSTSEQTRQRWCNSLPPRGSSRSYAV